MILLHKLPRPTIMDDSVDVGAIPANAKLVAGYVDGRFADFPAIVKRFLGKADLVSIGIFLGHLADFTDVEPGNPINTPRLVRADYEHRRAHGVWNPGYYGGRDAMARIIIPGLSGIPSHEYRLWLADWTMHLTGPPPGYAAVQRESLRSPNIDISVVNPKTFYPPDVKPKAHSHKIHVPPIVKHPAHLVPTGGGIGVGIAEILKTSGVHLTTAEGAALGAIFAALAGYFSHFKAGK